MATHLVPRAVWFPNPRFPVFFCLKTPSCSLLGLGNVFNDHIHLLPRGPGDLGKWRAAFCVAIVIQQFQRSRGTNTHLKEKLPSQKENNIPTIHFQGLCSTSGGYAIDIDTWFQGKIKVGLLVESVQDINVYKIKYFFRSTSDPAPYGLTHFPSFMPRYVYELGLCRKPLGQLGHSMGSLDAKPS